MSASNTSCELCHKVYNPRLGKLVHFWNNRAHVNCVRFVKLERNKAQYQALVAQAQQAQCDLCGETRAAVKCSRHTCTRIFHLGCVVASGGEVDYLAGKIVCIEHIKNAKSQILGECMICDWRATDVDGLRVSCCSGVLHATCAQIRCSSKHVDCPGCGNSKDYADEIRGCGVYISGSQDEIDFISELKGLETTTPSHSTTSVKRVVNSVPRPRISTEHWRIKRASLDGGRPLNTSVGSIQGKKLTYVTKESENRTDRSKLGSRSVDKGKRSGSAGKHPILIDLTEDASDDVKVVERIIKGTATDRLKKKGKNSNHEDSDFVPGTKIESMVSERNTSPRVAARSKLKDKLKLLLDETSDSSQQEEERSSDLDRDNKPTNSSSKTKVPRKTVTLHSGTKQSKNGGTSAATVDKGKKVLCRNDRDSKQVMPAKRKRRQRVERWILNGDKSRACPAGDVYRIQAESETESCSSETCSDLENTTPNLGADVEGLVSSKVRSGSESGYVTKSGSVSPLEAATVDQLKTENGPESGTKKGKCSDLGSRDCVPLTSTSKRSSVLSSATSRKRRRASDQENIAPKKQKIVQSSEEVDSAKLSRKDLDINPWLAKSVVLRVDSVADINNSDMILRHCFGEALDHLMNSDESHSSPATYREKISTSCAAVKFDSSESVEVKQASSVAVVDSAVGETSNSSANNKAAESVPTKRKNRKLFGSASKKKMHRDLVKLLDREIIDEAVEDHMEMPLEYHPSPDQSFCIDETENTSIQVVCNKEDADQTDRRNFKKKKVGKPLRELCTRPIINGRNWTPWRQDFQQFEPVNFDGVPEMLVRNISDFVDLNRGEKELLCLWNNFLAHKTFYGLVHLPEVIEKFIHIHGDRIISGKMYRNFVIHLSNLEQGGCIDGPTLLQLISRIQSKVDQGQDAAFSASRVHMQINTGEESDGVDDIERILDDFEKNGVNSPKQGLYEAKYLKEAGEGNGEVSHMVKPEQSIAVGGSSDCVKNNDRQREYSPEKEAGRSEESS